MPARTQGGYPNIPAARPVPLSACAVALAALAAVASRVALPAWLAPLVWPALFWLPGTLLVSGGELRAAVRGRAMDGAWMPWVLGPAVLGVFALVGRLAGLSFADAGLVPVLAAAVRIVLLRPERDGAAGESAGPRLDARAARWILLLGAALVLFAMWPPAVNEGLRLRDDARLHLPVVLRLLAGGVPPENPFLAGEPLAYFWFFHVIVAAAASFLAVPLDALAAAVNGHAFAGLLFGVAAAARRLGFGPVARGSALALLAFGLCPYGWMRLAWMRAYHPELNWALFDASGVHALLPMLCPTEPRLAGFLTKLSITNAFPLSLSLYVLATLPEGTASAFGRARRAFAAASTLLVHLVTGVLLLAGLGLRDLLAVARRRESARACALAAVPLLLAAAATLPYALDILSIRGAGTAVRFGVEPSRILGLWLPLVGVIALVLVNGTALLRHPDAVSRIAIALPAFALPFAARLVDGNEYKTSFLLLVLMAPWAGEGLNRLARGRWLLAALFLAPFLPTQFLASRQYAADTPPGLLPPRQAAELREAARALPEDAVVWRPGYSEDYLPEGYPVGRAHYLSDPYALRILGQWGTPEATRRSAELEAAARGLAQEALAAAARRVAPRPLFLGVSPEDRHRYPAVARLVDSGRLPPPAIRTEALTLTRISGDPGAPPRPGTLNQNSQKRPQP